MASIRKEINLVVLLLYVAGTLVMRANRAEQLTGGNLYKRADRARQLSDGNLYRNLCLCGQARDSEIQAGKCQTLTNLIRDWKRLTYSNTIGRICDIHRTAADVLSQYRSRRDYDGIANQCQGKGVRFDTAITLVTLIIRETTRLSLDFTTTNLL